MGKTRDYGASEDSPDACFGAPGRSDYASARAEGGSLGGALPATVRTEMPWPAPQFSSPYGAVYCLDDVIRSHLGGDATACRKFLAVHVPSHHAMPLCFRA